MGWLNDGADTVVGCCVDAHEGVGLAILSKEISEAFAKTLVSSVCDLLSANHERLAEKRVSAETGCKASHALANVMKVSAGCFGSWTAVIRLLSTSTSQASTCRCPA